MQGSPAEHLGSNVSKALNVHDVVLSQRMEVDPETGEFVNLRQAKLQAEVASQTLAIATKVDDNQLRREDFQLRNLDRMIDHMLDNYDGGETIDASPEE